MIPPQSRGAPGDCGFQPCLCERSCAGGNKQHLPHPRDWPHWTEGQAGPSPHVTALCLDALTPQGLIPAAWAAHGDSAGHSQEGRQGRSSSSTKQHGLQAWTVLGSFPEVLSVHSSSCSPGSCRAQSQPSDPLSASRGVASQGSLRTNGGRLVGSGPRSFCLPSPTPKIH